MTVRERILFEPSGSLCYCPHGSSLRLYKPFSGTVRDRQRSQGAAPDGRIVPASQGAFLRNLAFFHIDRHRSADVARSILGSDFDGALITDRYAAYNGVHPKERQVCLAHLVTLAKELIRELLLIEGASRDATSEAFCEEIAAFFSKA